MKEVDFIIVGAGLAGSLLAKELEKNNSTFHIFHSTTQKSASKIAIGLVNPITGKRLVKSWLIDELIPTAKSTYHQLESDFDKKMIHDCTVARVIPNKEIFEQWQKNFKEAVHQGYINDHVKSIEFGNKSWKYFEIKNCFWLDVPQLVRTLESDFKKNGNLTDCIFSYSDLKFGETIQYQNFKAKSIIFCEGWKVNENPFFNQLPFNFNKGEVAEIDIDNYSFEDVLKKNIFILPNKTGYKVGSTYDRDGELNDNITEKASQYFHQKLDEIGLNGNIISQNASIRPATKDRRPIIGSHHKHKSIKIFNGFGAKGVSLIPYFAKAFVKELQGGEKVIKEASTRRFIID